MVEHSRYNTGGDEGSVSAVLPNKLGLRDQESLDDAEALLLSDSYSFFLGQLGVGGFVFSVDLLFQIHGHFLGPLYLWAGRSRTVEISKGGVMFASSSHLSSALEEFDAELPNHIPDIVDSEGELAKKLSWIHCEFNAIHPFRDGNGRTIRLFMDLLMASLGRDPLELGEVEHSRYIEACRLGMMRDYSLMEKIFVDRLEKG